jgi:hypothetical protein
LAESELGELAKLAPDVVLDLGSRPANWDLARLTSVGLWAFRYDADGGSLVIAVRELWRGQRAAFAHLLQLGPDRGQVAMLETATCKTVLHSLEATPARLENAIVDWPARHLRRLLSGESPRLGPPPNACLAATKPSPLARLTLPAARARNLVRRLLQEAIEEHWNVGVLERPIETVLDGFDPAAVRWLPQRRGGCLADPFGRIEQGRTILLAEAYDLCDHHGYLVALELGGEGRETEPVKALRLPVHLSYPQVVEFEGRIYCLPEMSTTGRIQLFRGDPFPTRWIADRVLLEGFAGVDPTVFEHRGRWWMLAGDHADQDEAKLFLFYAPSLLGPWSPHRLNPVKCDLQSARPAEPPFEVGGRLHRPAQDCSMTYGGAIAINRIMRLGPEEFLEETVAVLRPDPLGPYPHGLHTLTALGSSTLIDGKYHSCRCAGSPTVSAAPCATGSDRRARAKRDRVTVARGSELHIVLKVAGRRARQTGFQALGEAHRAGEDDIQQIRGHTQAVPVHTPPTGEHRVAAPPLCRGEVLGLHEAEIFSIETPGGRGESPRTLRAVPNRALAGAAESARVPRGMFAHLNQARRELPEAASERHLREEGTIRAVKRRAMQRSGHCAAPDEAEEVDTGMGAQDHRSEAVGGTRPIRRAQRAVIGREPLAAGVDVVNQRVAEHHVRARFKHGHRRLEVAYSYSIVVREPFEISAAATLPHELEVRHRSQINCVAGVTNARVAARLVAADLSSPIGRRVVGYYELEIFERLVENRPERVLDEVLTVANRKPDADRGHGAAGTS